MLEVPSGKGRPILYKCCRVSIKFFIIVRINASRQCLPSLRSQNSQCLTGSQQSVSTSSRINDARKQKATATLPIGDVPVFDVSEFLSDSVVRDSTSLLAFAVYVKQSPYFRGNEFRT